jgi:3-oxoacyl-[acyl-carrier-protein] synthase-1
MRVYIGTSNIVSPLGFTTEENFEALLGGRKAVQQHQPAFPSGLLCYAEINNNSLDKRISVLGLKRELTKLEKMSVLSISDVIQKSGIDLKNKNTLLIISTTKGNIDLLENMDQKFKGREYLYEYAKTIGEIFNAVNAPMIVSNACISGLLAIIVAKRLIETDQYKNVLVCGADLVSGFTLSGFRSFNALSPEPSRPFDKDRTGINLGEAAATLHISADPVSNIIVSAGASANDANHISGPSRTGDGLFQAISDVKEKIKNFTPHFVSAHGTATEFNDEMESIAFLRSDLQNIPLHSLKGYYGHTLGTAGVLETIIGIECLKNDQLLSSAGFENQGTSVPLNLIRKNEKRELHSFLKTASGFGGCNAAAYFEKI